MNYLFDYYVDQNDRQIKELERIKENAKSLEEIIDINEQIKKK